MTALTLSSVQRDFEDWRKTRTKIGKIPEYLWTKALQILDHYPITEVTKALHLSGGQVASWRKQKNNVHSITPKPLYSANFVELKTPLVGVSSSDTNVFGKLEIKRPDGMVLVIEQLSAAAMLQVFSQFTQVVQ